MIISVDQSNETTKLIKNDAKMITDQDYVYKETKYRYYLYFLID